MTIKEKHKDLKKKVNIAEEKRNIRRLNIKIVDGASLLRSSSDKRGKKKKYLKRQLRQVKQMLFTR